MLFDRTGQDRTGQDRTGQDRTGQDRTGQDRTGQDRTGQDRTGQDRTGQDRTGQDNNAHGYNNTHNQKACRNMKTLFTSFHDLMLAVQTASNNRLPHSIDHFMESSLSEHTQEKLLKAVNRGSQSVSSIANAMIAYGIEADNGSIERVEEYLLRMLLLSPPRNSVVKTPRYIVTNSRVKLS